MNNVKKKNPETWVSAPGKLAYGGDANNPGTNAFAGNTGTDVPDTPASSFQTQPNAQQSGWPNNVQGTKQPTSSLISLPGVTDDIKQALGQVVSSGYKPSQQVSNALSQLQSVIAQQPAEFQSGYTAQLNQIMNSILGRPAFSYDMTSDPLFLNYRQQYMQQGRQAMEDAMGQSAALTGGYGSSYAASAGQQAYNQHLQQLNDRVPELHQMALDRYNAEGDALNQHYALVSDAYNRDYSEWQDAYNRWLNERDFAQSSYEADRNFGLQSESLALDRLAMQYDQANADRQFANADRDYYFDLALSMIDMGKTPPDSILLQAGLSAEEIEALRSTKKSSGSSSGKSSGSGKSTGGSSITSDYEEALKKLAQAAANKKKVSTHIYPGTSLGSMMRK